MAEVSLGGVHGVGVNFDVALHTASGISVMIGAGIMVCCADAHRPVNIVHIGDAIIRRHQ